MQTGANRKDVCGYYIENPVVKDGFSLQLNIGETINKRRLRMAYSL